MSMSIERSNSRISSIVRSVSRSSYNGYKKKELLGEGVFGKVYRVKKDGEVFAMKEMKNCDEGTDNEIEILKKANHKHIITYYDSFPSPGCPDCLNIVMEFADYGMMSSYVRNFDETSSIWRQSLGAEFCVWRILACLSEGLEYLHAFKPRPILHRDLKPDNILGVTIYNKSLRKNQTSWKLSDFGIAKLLEQESQTSFYTSTFAGTPIYMAPEVLRGEHYSLSADMWSLGAVVAFWCSVGEHLFSDLGTILEWKGEEGMLQWKGGASVLPDHYSMGLGRLVARLLHPDPKERPTAAEVVAECTDGRCETGQH